MRLLAAKEWNKIFFEGGEKYRLQVRAQLEQLDRNEKPYFSIGADIQRLARNGRKVWVAGGCLHDEILQHFPNLKPLVDLHLSDDDGVPLHAAANAAYWAGCSKFQERNIPMLAKHLRVSEKLAGEMCEWVDNFYGTEFDAITPDSMAWFNACEEFGLFVNWIQDAEQAVRLLNIVKEVN